jgi:hypothetical protein
MKEEHEAKVLDGLDSHRSAVDRIEGRLHEIVGKGTTSGVGSWHSGFHSSPGFLGVHLLLPKVWCNHDVICETDHLVPHLDAPDKSRGGHQLNIATL